MTRNAAFFLFLLFNSAGAAELQVPSVTIHPHTGFARIQSALYGQFIEHMGNCIYGGIWAELLHDRKFFLPVAAASSAAAAGNSPWKREEKGAGASVGMNTRYRYVGRWSVELALADADAEGKPSVADADAEAASAPSALPSAGIRHEPLSVRPESGYTGYVIARKLEKQAVTLEVIWRTATGGKETTDKKELQLTEVWTRHPFSFSTGKDVDRAELALRIHEGVALVGAVSLMPADNVEGFRADTLLLLKKLGGTVYRWPGGNFVSAYNWWEGIGARDRRPPFKNPSWNGIEHNDVGIDEFIRFCRLVDAEPCVVVNTGLGSPRMASALVEYCNGSPQTEWGAVRAKNGSAKPYAVKWWGVGNEMYGSWQHGVVPLKQYVRRHNVFARAMKKVDSNIKLVAVGSSGEWSKGMLTHCSDTMDLLSEHFYCPPDPDVLTHVRNMRDAVRGKANAHLKACKEILKAEYAGIPIALDEWNYAWNDFKHVYGDYGIQYSWRYGLGAAAGLCELVKWPRVFAMANWAQTVNVLGLVKTTQRSAAFEPTALPFLLFRHQFGGLKVKTEYATEPLEAAASISTDRSMLSLAVVNPTDAWRRLAVQVEGSTTTGESEVFVVAHPDPEACNLPGVTVGPAEEGSNPSVVIDRFPWTGMDLEKLPAPPYSFCVWRFQLGRPAQKLFHNPLEDLSSPPVDGAFFMLYAKKSSLYGAVSSDGLAWKAINEGKPLNAYKGTAPFHGISFCETPEGAVLVLEREGSFHISRTREWNAFTPLSKIAIPGSGKAALSDPCVFYNAERKTATLLCSFRSPGSYSTIKSIAVSAEGACGRPQPALSRGYHLGGLSLLRGRVNRLFYYDSRLGTCCAAESSAPAGPYVPASPGIGRFQTDSPNALFTGRRVLLYLADKDGGLQVLQSNDLRLWSGVPEGRVKLPDKEIDCFAAGWLPASLEKKGRKTEK